MRLYLRHLLLDITAQKQEVAGLKDEASAGRTNG
jgi:hypothetical protein